MYGDWFEMQVERWEGDMDYAAWLREAAKNLFESMDYCTELSETEQPYPGENLASIAPGVVKERARLQRQLDLLNAKTAGRQTASAS
jgi:hypothetical protein